jgi:hypothetical protein
MRRATIISTCLLNNNMVNRLEDGEREVENLFHNLFPGEKFDDWNIDVNEKTAREIVSSVGRAGSIRVDRFINVLRHIR